jgi:hypothetical protein
MRKWLPLLAISIFISSCVPSIHPLYKQGETIVESFLLGEWKSGDESWNFTNQVNDHYLLSHNDGENSAEFEVHMVKLDGKYFLDITPREVETCDYLQSVTTLSVHTFAYIEPEGDNIQLRFMSMELLENGLKSGGVSVSHIKDSEEAIILTAQTDELQAFVVKNLDLFSEEMVLTKEK